MKSVWTKSAFIYNHVSVCLYSLERDGERGERKRDRESPIDQGEALE